MHSPRLAQLKQFLEEEPHDPFNWYALALEYMKSDLPKAHALFATILIDFPDYIPVYYQAGMVALALNDEQKARLIFENGIRCAQLKNDLKAAGELRSALDDLC